MKYVIKEIYRVMNTDQYQHTKPETCWTTDKKSCEDFIKQSRYGSSLTIQKAILSDKAVRICE